MSQGVSERKIRREMFEHPWASRKIAMQIALDHVRKKKTTTPEGRREYMRNYMRVRRQVPDSKLTVPDLTAALGLKKRRRQK
jgi:hypothetical protein